MTLALAAFATNFDTARAETAQWTAWPKPVPDFALPAVDGGTAAFAGADDRVVLVHFFATWCAPCRAELPALQRFAARAGAARLTVLVVSVAEPDSRVRRLRDALALTLPILLDRDRAVTKAWQVALLPTSVLLGPSTRLGVEADMAWDEVDPNALVRAAMAPRPEPGAGSGEPSPEPQREEAHSEGG